LLVCDAFALVTLASVVPALLATDAWLLALLSADERLCCADVKLVFAVDMLDATDAKLLSTEAMLLEA